MIRDPASGRRWGISVLGRPWGLVLTGLALLFLDAALHELGRDPSASSPVPVRVPLMLLGLILAGLAVSLRLRTAGQELEDRVESAGLLSVAAFATLVGIASTDEDWDSIRLLLAVLACVALTGSVLVLLPRTPRRIVASLWIFFHFGGITTAVTAVAPRDQPAPWLSLQLWARVYRPYLQFMYLTNAYHFYSPDPGPPSLLWFRVQYEDNSYRWIKLPVRKESPFGLHFQRRLALAEMVNQPTTTLPLSEFEKAQWERHTGQTYDHDTWDVLLQRRQVGATQFEPPLYPPADVMANLQYSEPQDYAKRLVASYARHVARDSPHPHAPEVPVTNVRVYRVTHLIISPGQIAENSDPLDPVFYSPIYLGKFDPDGKLLDPQDPLLYWYVPMVYVPPDYGTGTTNLVMKRDRTPADKFLNGVEVHAGDTKKLQ
jgi:hypothetical protein